VDAGWGMLAGRLMSKHPDDDDRECENDVSISSTGENEDDASISDCLGRLDTFTRLRMNEQG